MDAMTNIRINKQLRDEVERLNAKCRGLESEITRLRDAIPNLQYVIDWLSNGCDVSDAVKELQIHQALIAKIRSE